MATSSSKLAQNASALEEESPGKMAKGTSLDIPLLRDSVKFTTKFSSKEASNILRGATFIPPKVEAFHLFLRDTPRHATNNPVHHPSHHIAT